MTDGGTIDRKNGGARQTFRHLLKAAPVILILFFLVRSILTNLDSISELSTGFDLARFTLATVFILAYMFLNAALWKVVMARFDIRVRHFDTFWTFFLAMFGKYIPGKIWLAAVRIMKLKGAEDKRRSVAGSIILEHFYLLASAMIFFLLIWGWDDSIQELGLRFPIFAGSLALVALIIFRPQLTFDLFNLILKRLGRETIPLKIGRWESAVLFMLYLATWIFSSLGAWLAVAAVTDIPVHLILKTGSAFAFSYVVGLVTLLAPGGIGVREGVFTVLLTAYFPAYICALFAFSLRLAYTLAEVLGLAVLYIIGRIQKEKPFLS